VARHRRRLLAGTLAILLVPTMASAQDAELEQRLDDQADARDQAERDLAEVTVAESDAQRRLRETQQALDAAEAELAERELALADARARLERAGEELTSARHRAEQAHARYQRAARVLERTEVELSEQRTQLEGRIRAAFKYGQVSFAEALSGVHDIADFLNSSTYVGRVMDNDRILVERVLELLDQAANDRAAADGLREAADAEAVAAAAAEAVAAAAADEVAAAAEQQRAKTAEVAERRTEQQAALEGLREDRVSIEGHLAGLDAESARIEAQLAEIARQQAEEAERLFQEELRRQEEERKREEEERRRREEEERKRREEAEARGQEPEPAPLPVEPEPEPEREVDRGSGPWLRPVVGRMTSPFGPRWGRNHNGVDLAGGVGANVVASQGGLVVYVVAGCHPTSSWGCGGGFGNYVMVAHPGGMATVSAHLSTVAVSVGQNVTAGQSLGQVGNSGNSYGSHLHFEIRDGGVPQNPCGYITC